MLKIRFDTSPLKTGHAGRGIGVYTKNLLTALQKQHEIELVNDLKEKVDIIHYPFFDFFSTTLPLNYSKKVVVTIHDVIPLEFPEFYKPGLRGKAAFYKQLLSLRFVSAIITDSEYSKQQIIRRLGIGEDKIFVTYLAASNNLAKATAEDIERYRNTFSLPKDYILYVGDINYNKNIPQLIKALKFLPDSIHLVCVGKNFYAHDIPEWRWIEAQVTLSDVEKRVHFITDLPPESETALAAIYSGAVCYIQPSLSEGFGLPVLEALQCGCPVICANKGSLPEVGGAVAFYVEPTAEEFAHQVEKILMLESKEKAAFSYNAIAWAKQFNWNKTAEKTIAVYHKVAKSAKVSE